jgi:hypothetical protein
MRHRRPEAVLPHGSVSLLAIMVDHWRGSHEPDRDRRDRSGHRCTATQDGGCGGAAPDLTSHLERPWCHSAAMWSASLSAARFVEMNWTNSSRHSGLVFGAWPYSRYACSVVTALMRYCPVRHDYEPPDDPDVLPLATAVAVVPVTFNTLNKWVAGIGDMFALGILNEAIGKL